MPVVPTPFPTADPGSTAGAVAVGGGDQGGGAPSAGPLAPASPSSSGGGIPLWIPLVLAGLLLGFGGAAFLVQRGANRP